jgi:hypothetical protein
LTEKKKSNLEEKMSSILLNLVEEKQWSKNDFFDLNKLKNTFFEQFPTLLPNSGTKQWFQLKTLEYCVLCITNLINRKNSSSLLFFDALFPLYKASKNYYSDCDKKYKYTDSSSITLNDVRCMFDTVFHVEGSDWQKTSLALLKLKSLMSSSIYMNTICDLILCINGGSGEINNSNLIKVLSEISKTHESCKNSLSMTATNYLSIVNAILSKVSFAPNISQQHQQQQQQPLQSAFASSFSSPAVFDSDLSSFSWK